MTTAEYPAARLVPASPTNWRTRIRPVDLIIVHTTDGHALAGPVAEMWRDPHHGSSAHYVIGQNADVIQAVPLNGVAYHAHDANGHSIGIEHCARQPGEPAFGAADPGLALSEVQLLASAKLVAWLCARFALPIDRVHIMGHAAADPKSTHRDCPDGVRGGWPWDRYLALVRQG